MAHTIPVLYGAENKNPTHKDITVIMLHTDYHRSSSTTLDRFPQAPNYPFLLWGGGTDERDLDLGQAVPSLRTGIRTRTRKFV